MTRRIVKAAVVTETGKRSKSGKAHGSSVMDWNKMCDFNSVYSGSGLEIY